MNDAWIARVLGWVERGWVPDALVRWGARRLCAMRAKAMETPPGFWVEGYMYDDKKLADGRSLTRLDSSSGFLPLQITYWNAG